MFDFRYHALSLVAVLVALVVGLLLGVAIGDQGLVSSAERGLRDDLRGDVRDAQLESTGLREELERRQRYEELTLPRLVGDQLDSRRVDLLFVGERSEAVFDSVRDAVEAGGGELSLVGTLAIPLDAEAIAEAATGTSFSRLPDDPRLVDDLGRRVGTQLVRGGRFLTDIRRALLSSSSGPVGPSEAVVIFRTPSDELEDPASEQLDTFVDGLFDGIRAAGAPVAGVEETTTEPSQIGWYREHGLGSVDNVDEVPGRASLVLLLSGAADGAFGIKATRDAYVPDALTRGP